MIIEKSCQKVNSNSGILLAKPLLDGLSELQKFDSVTPVSKRASSCRRHTNQGIIRSNILLGVMGKSSYCDISRHESDSLFAHVLGGNVASQETYRQRLEKIAESNTFYPIIDEANLQLLTLFRDEDYGLVDSPSCESRYLPVDMDVSVLVNDDCKKESVGRTYHNVDGYAPIFATVGKIGMQVANELRCGTQHSQKDFCPFLKRVVGMCKRLTGHELLVRLDSAHDAAETVRTCFELDDELSAESKTAKTAAGIRFIVKRNLRSGSKAKFIEAAKTDTTITPITYRNEKKKSDVTIWRGCVSHLHPKGLESRAMFCVYEVVETKSDEELLPMTEVSAWWTNMYETAETVIQLYHEHATHEQFHSELKSDMGIERLASGKFLANKLMLALATLSFNILRIIGQTALKVKPVRNVVRMRLRTVLQQLIYVGGIFGSHSGRKRLRLGCENSCADLIIEVHKKLAAA